MFQEQTMLSFTTIMGRVFRNTKLKKDKKWNFFRKPEKDPLIKIPAIESAMIAAKIVSNLPHLMIPSLKWFQSNDIKLDTNKLQNYAEGTAVWKYLKQHYSCKTSI